MLILSEISKKVQEILNNSNSGFLFVANGTGFILDSIVDKEQKENFIPVFVAQSGGEYTAIPDISQADGEYTITIYFPVVFKNKFYELGDYIAQSIVGKQINFGENTGNCICNISVPTFNDIEDLDVLTEFKKWVSSNYNYTITKTEVYSSMTFTLYLSNAKNIGEEDGFIYANGLTKPTISITDGVNTYTLDNPIFLSQTFKMDAHSNAQQLLGENYVKGIVATSTYSRMLPLYVQNNDFFKTIFSFALNRKLNTLKLTITDTNPLDTSETITRDYYISSYEFVPNLGNLLGITLNLNDLLEI